MLARRAGSPGSRTGSGAQVPPRRLLPCPLPAPPHVCAVCASRSHMHGHCGRQSTPPLSPHPATQHALSCLSVHPTCSCPCPGETSMLLLQREGGKGRGREKGYRMRSAFSGGRGSSGWVAGRQAAKEIERVGFACRVCGGKEQGKGMGREGGRWWGVSPFPPSSHPILLSLAKFWMGRVSSSSLKTETKLEL